MQRATGFRNEFESEVFEHLDALYRAAFRLTGSANDAEDLVQETVLRALRFADRYEPGTRLKAWLLKIMTNQFINQHRRRGREREAMQGASAELIGEGVMSRASMRSLKDPVALSQSALIAKELQAALATLSEDARCVVVLSDVEGLSYREIAETLNCPIGTVMSRLHRARASLKQELENHAEALGITSPTPTLANAPVSLATFRARRKMR